ncbi:hypothetical protein GC093_05155 [Paenibacillus sp. LMG 31456]|uniref:Uncharacterized protein n=1 Tax=Paenibacillus foliorum TaxID=2654974 RepID=A0A972K085_9BACL|nr:hypothetical protein [Paenibacillus foliorum]NOU92618.1 hypothetical protein [Paenibacillus foliorum]
MNKRTIFIALLTASILASGIPTTAAAAPINFTTSIKSSLDKTIAAAESSQADKINSLYDELLMLQKQSQDLDVEIKALHTRNQETSASLSKEIQQIDADNLDKLESEVTQTREQYKALFSHYSSLNKQIEAARMLKNKDLNSMLRFQVNILKIPVQLARINISTKENEWRAAKDLAAKKKKEIRGSLEDIAPVNLEIKSKRSSIKTIETDVTPVWNTFKQAAKKSEPLSVLDTLASLISLTHQINEEKQAILNLENKIGDILSIAKAQMP